MNNRFELTNQQRKYLGLNPIEEHWEAVDIKGSLYYFDGDVIRKEISTSGYHEETFRYMEVELEIHTAENRTIVLPKTAKGKPKKLNFTATQSFRPVGMGFTYDAGYIRMIHYTTQKTYYSEGLKVADATEALETWLRNWIKETTESDLAELETFKQEKRTHQKYREGDIFAFKIGRRKFGFGKILIDIVSRRKTEEFQRSKNYGLANLMGTALIVKVYHKISDSMDVNLDELEHGLSLPPQAVMDNRIFYGEHPIIGNRQVTYADFDDGPISTGRSINHLDLDIAYLQYGLIYREMPFMEYDLYRDESWYHKDYRAEGIGFFLELDELEACIDANSNEPFYCNSIGPNSSGNQKDKDAIFKVFGLDAALDYEGNMKKCAEAAFL